MLHGALRAYTRAGLGGITILPPGVVYPIDWRTTVWGPRDWPGDIHSICNPPHPRFNATFCKSHFPNAYASTPMSLCKDHACRFAIVRLLALQNALLDGGAAGIQLCRKLSLQVNTCRQP